MTTATAPKMNLAEAWAIKSDWDDFGEVTTLDGVGSIDVEQGVLTYDVRDWFVHGNCVLFALLASQKVSGAVVSIATHTGENKFGEKWSHAFMTMPDGSVFDGNGWTAVEQIHDDFYSTGVTSFDVHDEVDRVALACIVKVPGSELFDFSDTVYCPADIVIAEHFVDLILNEIGMN